MNPFLLEKLELLRKELNEPIILTDSNSKSGHVPNSYHYIGKAVDFKTKADKLKVANLIVSLGFGGIGWYTMNYWHIDTRTTDTRSWIGINNSPTDFSKITYNYFKRDEYLNALKKQWGLS
jgi:hypothetical protein